VKTEKKKKEVLENAEKRMTFIICANWVTQCHQSSIVGSNLCCNIVSWADADQNTYLPSYGKISFL